MQNIYLLLKCDAHREQQGCHQQVSHALAVGVQAQHPQRTWGWGPGPPTAPKAQRRLPGHREATSGLRPGSHKWGTSYVRQEEGHRDGRRPEHSGHGRGAAPLSWPPAPRAGIERRLPTTHLTWPPLQSLNPGWNEEMYVWEDFYGSPLCVKKTGK